jgi:hypothetical protein
VLRERGGRPLKGHNVTFSVRRSERLIVDDLGAVPDRLKKTTVEIVVKKDAAKQALRSGESVPGVHVEQHESLLRK